MRDSPAELVLISDVVGASEGVYLVLYNSCQPAGLAVFVSTQSWAR